MNCCKIAVHEFHGRKRQPHSQKLKHCGILILWDFFMHKYPILI